MTPAAQTLRSPSIRSPDAVTIARRGRFDDLGVGQHPDAERLELQLRRLGELLRQGRQEPRTGFDQGHLQPRLVEHFEPVMAQGRGGIVELGAQLDAGRAAADDGDLHMLVGLRVRAHPSATRSGND